MFGAQDPVRTPRKYPHHLGERKGTLILVQPPKQDRVWLPQDKKWKKTLRKPYPWGPNKQVLLRKEAGEGESPFIPYHEPTIE